MYDTGDVKGVPGFCQHQRLKFDMALVSTLATYPPEARGDSVNVGIYWENLSVKGIEHHAFGHFVGHAGQRNKILVDRFIAASPQRRQVAPPELARDTP